MSILPSTTTTPPPPPPPPPLPPPQAPSTISGSSFTALDQTFTANPTAVYIDGTTITANGPGITVSGTPVGLNSLGELVSGSKTIDIPAGDEKSAQGTNVAFTGGGRRSQMGGAWLFVVVAMIAALITILS